MSTGIPAACRGKGVRLNLCRVTGNTVWSHMIIDWLTEVLHIMCYSNRHILYFTSDWQYPFALSSDNNFGRVCAKKWQKSFLGGMGNFAPHFLGSIKDNQQRTFHIDSWGTPCGKVLKMLLERLSKADCKKIMKETFVICLCSCTARASDQKVAYMEPEMHDV